MWRSTNQSAAFRSRGITAPTLLRAHGESSSRGAREGPILTVEPDLEPFTSVLPLPDRRLVTVGRDRLARGAQVGRPGARCVRDHAAGESPRTPLGFERRSLRNHRADPLLV